ncbi:hypothetical protein GH714_008199 [Hevea brasiliensis]|uniref:Phytocyanin domain-containing protein n=1 Tax=Hevea brasiliensis TaxID=3981 RepID=A0A6A6KD10_HEVBR|nr:hypothetical protein GH714_008199 [Hevea brasiliensis]
MAAKTVSRSNYLIKAFNLLGLLSIVVLAERKCNPIHRWRSEGLDLFVYKPDQDSVLQVTKEDYDNCATTAALATFKDGHTVFTFNRSGPHYFISGNKDNCLKNEKLVVVVLASRSNQSSNASPPPSAETGVIPSPAPAGEGSPPTGTVETSPTPSPAGETPNAASSTFISFTGSIGAFFASSLILVF